MLELVESAPDVCLPTEPLVNVLLPALGVVAVIHFVRRLADGGRPVRAPVSATGRLIRG